MGMFDTIVIDADVAKLLNICCKNCKRLVLELQTKSFDSVMDSFYLTHNKDNNVSLLKLEEPDKERFWHEYTNEEIKQYNEKNKKETSGVLYPFFQRHVGDGEWLQEAWLPENRAKTSVPDWPHQYVNAYVSCDKCEDEKDSHKNWIEYNFKFTDGVLQGVTWAGPTYK